MRKSLVILLITVSLPTIALVNYYIISVTSRPFLFDNFADLPQFENVLVLGAGRIYPSDNPNYAFTSRIAAAERLSDKAFIRRIILSGRNESPHYNETEAMRSALKKRTGDKKLVIDTASNTIKSLSNYQKRFGTAGVILISNKEHLERALFYSRFQGINAAGYIAETKQGFTLREAGARLKTSLLLLFSW
jgi:SanA protein